MTILPCCYLPTIEYFAHLAQRDCVIDIGEHYIKRSERNRARIMTAAGVMELSVNVQRANRPCIPMRDMKIDYSKKWLHQHRVAILSAYKSSPFYDHYAPYFEEVFSGEYEGLTELNMALINLLIKLIGIPTKCTVSEDYVEATAEDIDLRPKRRESKFSHAEYTQVFYDRVAFVENLSILDLLFCEGPATRGVLLSCSLSD